MCNDEHENGNIVAKTIFTSEEIKKFALQQGFAGFASICAKLPGFLKDFLMSYGPGDASHRQCKQKKIDDLKV